MKKYFLIFALFVLVISASCTSSGASDNVSEPKTYRITRETGLYARADVDAEQIGVLSSRTLVKSTNRNGMGRLTCVTDREFNITVCKIEVVSSGEEGWVLKKCLED